MKHKLIFFLLISMLLVFFSGNLQASDPEKSLAVQISEMFNLETDLLVKKYTYASDEVALWIEPMEGQEQLVKNWGLVLLNRGKPVDSWFYTGPLTNVFQEFHLSFHQFTPDGRKELTVVGTDNSYQGWAYFFVFNLTETSLELLIESETNRRGGGYFVKPEEIYSQGMFLDLDLDQIEELFIYREVKGTLPLGPCWADIYSWSNGEFVKVNQKYPVFYIPFFNEFEKAAREEEKLSAGNHRLFYEYMAEIYRIWQEDKGVEEALLKASLPPLEMGKKIEKFLANKAQGYRISKLLRRDLDGVPPLDSLLWLNEIDGQSQKICLISQKDDQASEPLLLSLPADFFNIPAMIEVITKPGQLQFSRSPLASTPGLAYCFAYQDSASLIGWEEVELKADGGFLRTVLGQMLTEYRSLDSREQLTRLPLILAKETSETINLDGIIKEDIWSKVEAVNYDQKNAVISGLDNWRGPEDLSFTLQTAYHQDTLYLSLNITDDLRKYAENSNLNQNSDHLEIWLEDAGQIYHYQIFILPLKIEVVELKNHEFLTPTHKIRGQWIPQVDGYRLEIAISGLNLDQETYPLTVIIKDADQVNNLVLKTTMSSSLAPGGADCLLGKIKLD